MMLVASAAVTGLPSTLQITYGSARHDRPEPFGELGGDHRQGFLVVRAAVDHLRVVMVRGSVASAQQSS